MGDPCAHGGVITGGCAKVLIGTSAGAGLSRSAPVPFPPYDPPRDLVEAAALLGAARALIEAQGHVPRYLRVVLEHDGHQETVTIEEPSLLAGGVAKRPRAREPAPVTDPREREVAQMQREVMRRMREAMPEAGVVAQPGAHPE